MQLNKEVVIMAPIFELDLGESSLLCFEKKKQNTRISLPLTKRQVVAL